MLDYRGRGVDYNDMQMKGVWSEKRGEVLVVSIILSAWGCGLGVWLCSKTPTPTHAADTTSKFGHPDVPGEGIAPIDARPRGCVAQSGRGEDHGSRVATDDGTGPQGAGGTRKGGSLRALLLLLQL